MEYYETDTVRSIPGVGPTAQANLLKLGIRNLRDVLTWYPRTYIDASHPVLAAEVPEGELVAVHLQVLRSNLVRTKQRGMTMVEARGVDASGELHLRWFNQPYVAQKLQPGTVWTFIGTVRRYRGERVMVSPLVEQDPRILSIYAQTSGVTSKQLRGYAEWAVRHVHFSEYDVPETLRSEFGIVSRLEALRLLHLPTSLAEVEIGRRAVAYAEVFWFFCRNLLSQEQAKRDPGITIPIDTELLKQLVARLPFTLTPSQKRAVWDIAQDMASGQPMTRLLNGDVGSGKTVVAALAAALVAKAGSQTIFLVPTEVLAKQHQQNLVGLLGEVGFNVALWTASEKGGALEADLVVGTHAVLQETFTLPRLGLVIIDEQHRFGVRQRRLLRQGQAKLPHVLSMTATPIPRTLALVLYGDLAVSVLREKPAERLPVITEVIWNRDRERMHERIVLEQAKGHGVFVICSLIEEKAKEDAESTLYRLLDVQEEELQERKTVLAEAERLRQEHPEYGVIGVVHGRLKPEEKRTVLEQFARGEINLLVATSVIEVGIDIPRATVMVVEGAERFGLAQLHQFRGRVGRSNQQSYCFLCPTHYSEVVATRLRALTQYQSGFDLAEVDLALRGPGDLSGLSQSGLPDFRMASLTDQQFLLEVKEVAERYVREHPAFLEQVAALTYSTPEGGLE